MGFGESWGSQAQVDSITGFMTNLLEQHNLVDIPMNKPLPTWRNKRVGDATLARILDRFMIKVPLMNQLHHYKQWVDSRGSRITLPFIWKSSVPIPNPKLHSNLIMVGFQTPVTLTWSQIIGKPTLLTDMNP